MLLSEPPETDYDLRFMLFGFPVRISWTFWLGAVVFGHGFCQSFAYLYGSPVFDQGQQSLGTGPLLVIWTLCLFLSILIHELGHAFAFQRYGIHSSIVLYHFGGLAIPTSSFMPGRSLGRIGPREQLIISAAGPAFQIVSAILLILIVKMGGYEVAIFKGMPAYLDRIPWVSEGNMIDNQGLYAIVTFYVFPSIVWALLNLMPVWPLDGGHITRSVVLLNGGTIAQSLWISVVASGALALYAFQSEQRIMALFFALFGFSSYQMLTSQRGW